MWQLRSSGEGGGNVGRSRLQLNFQLCNPCLKLPHLIKKPQLARSWGVVTHDSDSCTIPLHRSVGPLNGLAMAIPVQIAT